jgi:V/A-type H+-transporting ATPase subunit E
LAFYFTRQINTAMDNKLEQLTQKLYEEGLAKGRSEGERMVAEAEGRAKKIVAEAEERAREIARRAEAAAEELRKNTMTELSLAGREAVSKIKAELTGLITTRAISDGVRAAGLDAAFVKEMLLAVARNWNGASSEKISLQALLPEAKRAELEKALAGSVAELLAAGVEVGYSRDVRSGFKVGPREGGYYIDFSDESFGELLGEYLNPRVSRILYGDGK